MDLVGYLETLSSEAVAKLYTSPWTCQAVLRALSPLGKQYALRMTFLETPISNSMLESWSKPEGWSKHKSAIQKLQKLQILQTGPLRHSEETWQLQADFKSHLRLAISTPSLTGSQDESVSEEVLCAAPSRQRLDDYADKQWEALNLYLIGSGARPPAHAPHLSKRDSMNIDNLLTSAGLMALESGVRGITERGFQFLLLDTYHQLWVLLKQYTKLAAESGVKLAAVVSFLLQLGCQGVGIPISGKRMDELQQSVASELARLGYLLPFVAGDQVWLSPTRLSLALSGGQSMEAQKEVSDGFILVETNYKVVAYTSSPLRLSILQLFVHCDVVLPNCFIGTLTRQSVTDALKAGIDHEQIVQYLSQHAAPQVANDIPIVPAVVSDQIRLWQAETQRVRSYKAHMYDDFESLQLYLETVAQAKELGTWLYDDPLQKRLIALSDGHVTLRDHIKASKVRLGN